MRILTVSWQTPRPELAAGDLRFFALLRLLAEGHEVSFLPLGAESEESVYISQATLGTAGVRCRKEGLEAVLAGDRFDIVIAEFFSVGAHIRQRVRAWQPAARLVIDSVDIHFHRLRSLASLSGDANDAASAEAMRTRELAAYAAADLIITVSDEDSSVLRNELPDVPTFTIPLIHEMLPLTEKRHSEQLELIFVGGYAHAPNVDAVVYFCREVLPLILEKIPNTRLRLIGSKINSVVEALAGKNVQVLGFVESTHPYLSTSDVSVAPLRFGGGIKGKICEAMAHGLPVVTTPVGAEGFGFNGGSDILIAHDTQTFADAVISLWTDSALYTHVRRNGWNRINERYSTSAVATLLPEFITHVMVQQRKVLSWHWRLRTKISYWKMIRRPKVKTTL